MRKLSIPGLAVCFAALWTACAEDVYIDPGDITPKLVVNALLTPDSSFAVHLSSSLLATSTSAYRIPDDAKVSLIDVTDPEEGQVINLYRENDVFVSPLQFPSVGRSYKIFVQVPGFVTAEAVTRIPEAVGLASYTLISDTTTSTANSNRLNVKYTVTLNFNAHTHRYFHFLFVQSATRLTSGTDPITQEIAYFISPQFPNEDGFYEHPEQGILIDAEQTGSMDAITFTFIDYMDKGLEEVLGNLHIEMRSVTQDYYTYYTSLSKQLRSRDDPFAEPIPVISNVRDGHGVFAGYTSKYYGIPVLP